MEREENETLTQCTGKCFFV